MTNILQNNESGPNGIKHEEIHLTTKLLLTMTQYRHAKSREPGNLVLGHFWRKICTFSENLRFKDIFVELLETFGLSEYRCNYVLT